MVMRHRVTACQREEIYILNHLSFWRRHFPGQGRRNNKHDSSKMNVEGLAPLIIPPPITKVVTGMPIPIPNVVTGPISKGNLRDFPHVDSIAEFLNITLIPPLLAMLTGQKYAPKTTGYVLDEYDYIIIGAGAAGCVLANRLSEIRNASVLLLEAGKSPPILTEIPGIARDLLSTEINYNYISEPQKDCSWQLPENRIPFSAGKGIGGSSLINAMLYIRGHHKDYDTWAEMGAANWSWNDVYPFFQRLENNTDPDFLANGCHSTGGPMTAGRARYVSDMRPVLLEAAKSLGWKINDDPNCGKQEGLADHQTFTRNGQRCSAAKAYLVPVDDRRNLHIVSQAFVTKIQINPETKTAEGVYFDFGIKGRTRYVKARRRVIISAGALNTPKLLMLSGVGPREELEKHGIQVLADLAVGKNFQDHFSTTLFFYRHGPSYMVKALEPSSVLRYATDRSGPLASPNGVYGISFNRSSDASTIKDVPNYEAYFLEGENAVVRLPFRMKRQVYLKLFSPYEQKATLWCISSTTNPKSTGYVSLYSADPYQQPKIDPQFLRNKDDLDDIVAGMNACMDMAETPAMKAAGVKPFEEKMLGCENSTSRDEYFRCYAKSFGFTIGHQSCTARMGSESDTTAVVTPQLRVKGIKNLNVVDASVMPKVVSGNTMIPTLMIAEKASDMFKKEDAGGA